MTDRFKAARRVLAVQTQLHRLAQWKLIDLERKEEALKEHQNRLLEFINEEGGYTALFGAALTRRLRGVNEEKAQVQAAKDKQADRTMEESRRVGRMQRMVDDLGDVAQREADRNELRDVLERINHRRNASLR